VRLIETRPSASVSGGEVPGDSPLEETSADPGVLLQRTVPDTMRIRRVDGGEDKGEETWVVIDVDGVARAHTVEIVDPRGEIRTLSFNGFTGEVERVD
jgi:hypothetical protein